MSGTTTPERFAAVSTEVRSQVAAAVVGLDDVVDDVLVTILAGGHCLLEGVPGVGKTLLCRSLAAALGLPFGRIQFTPDLMPADIVGTDVLTDRDDGTTGVEFRPGPVFTSILLADEINRATPKTQSALLEAMEERQVTVSRRTRPLPEPFFVLATQNPIELDGTYPLPEAQLDRFATKVSVPTPSHDQLLAIIDQTTGRPPQDVTAVTDAPTLLAMQALVREVVLAPHLRDLIATTVLRTHPDHPDATESTRRNVLHGAGPRAAVWLALCAKARALVQGRANVAESDVERLKQATIAHRVQLAFDADPAVVSLF